MLLCFNAMSDCLKFLSTCTMFVKFLCTKSVPIALLLSVGDFLENVRSE